MTTVRREVRPGRLTPPRLAVGIDSLSRGPGNIEGCDSLNILDKGIDPLPGDAIHHRTIDGATVNEHQKLAEVAAVQTANTHSPFVVVVSGTLDAGHLSTPGKISMVQGAERRERVLGNTRGDTGFRYSIEAHFTYAVNGDEGIDDFDFLATHAVFDLEFKKNARGIDILLHVKIDYF